MTTRAQVTLTLMLYKIRAHNHTSSIPMEKSHLLYYFVEVREVDVAQIILNEIRTIVENGSKLGEKSNFPLALLGLIMGLCQRARMCIPSQAHEIIIGVMDDRYISRYCRQKPAITLDEE
ncbi:hypothetical protein KIW84_032031 [Lathyrus oleraceus]|uniref:Uncharacterized protein n=1 Tax=Pisum sativum TaxID=3888 RepID=A0A9D4XS53_PEA|nr:hypothetical protein KIW84_032031 [Pisum sativum]